MLFVPLALWLVVLIVAGSMVVLGLVPAPGSGERRCPECWYDLSRVWGGAGKVGGSGGGGTRCPECQHRPRRPLDVYPTRRRWWLVAAGAALATPALLACAEATFEDPAGRVMLMDFWALIRVAAIGVIVSAAWLLARTVRRWARAWSRGRASPHEWKALALLACVLMFQGACLWLFPATATQRWNVIPAPIRWVFEQMFGDPQKANTPVPPA
ncbi:MAG: hypothetical protein AB7K52_12955 [Phycisphaerales bacterium]